MHAESKRLLKESIHNCLPTLNQFSKHCLTQHLLYKKESETQWSTRWEWKTDISQVLLMAETTINSAKAIFSKSFFNHHPEYDGMVGSSSSGLHLWAQDRIYFFDDLILYLWKTHKTFEIDETEIDELINAFESFIDNSTFTLRFRSVLLNFHSSTIDCINLPEGLRIRRLNENEISELHGGSQTLIMFRERSFSMNEFCIEGEIEEHKVVGDSSRFGTASWDSIKAKLDKAMLCLRTFKAGCIGYDFIEYFPVNFVPLRFGSYKSLNEYVPLGVYRINDEEITSLEEHSRLIFKVNEDAMYIACTRLSDAENRVRPQDRIIDAVIGLESLLLNGMNSELSFRFSLNYAMLFQSQERESKFKFAQDIYGLRSKISHGSPIGKEVKINNQKVTIEDAAKNSVEALRGVILFFLKERDSPYTKKEFWSQKYFGLPEPHLSNSSELTSEQ